MGVKCAWDKITRWWNSFKPWRRTAAEAGNITIVYHDMHLLTNTRGGVKGSWPWILYSRDIALTHGWLVIPSVGFRGLPMWKGHHLVSEMPFQPQSKPLPLSTKLFGSVPQSITPHSYYFILLGPCFNCLKRKSEAQNARTFVGVSMAMLLLWRRINYFYPWNILKWVGLK